MAIKMIPVTCPNCGGQLEAHVTDDFFFCRYCGSKIILNDDSVRTININKKVEKHVRDDARIEEAKYHAQKDENKSTILLIAVVLIGSIILFAILFGFMGRALPYLTSSSKAVPAASFLANSNPLLPNISS
jgi:uncharacterized membrane protein YvbJ